jgi:hypothetical protein
MKSVVSFLQDCRLGKKQVYSNLTVFPVLLPAITEPYYLTLEQAIEQEMLVVTEVDAARKCRPAEVKKSRPATDTLDRG